MAKYDKSKPRSLATALMKAVARKAPIRSKINKDFSPDEIAEIKRGIDHDKKVAEIIEKNEANITERIERREKLRKVKAIAKKMEIGNQSRVILFPSFSGKTDSDQWYKLGEFSALYYIYRMADRMGRSAKPQKDSDRFAKMKVIASVTNMEKFLRQVKDMHEFDRVEKTEDGIYILYMKQPLSDVEYMTLRRTANAQKEMMHNVLKPKRADTALYQCILMLDRQMLPRVAKMRKEYFKVVGEKMAHEIIEITQVYLAFADGRLGVEETKDRMLWLTEGLRAGISALGENDVWGYDIATSIGENIAMLEKHIKEL